MWRMVELFSGSAVLGRAFAARGWEVVTVDLAGRAGIGCDVRLFRPPPADFVWASPPCAEFTRAGLPWHPDFGRRPSCEMVEESLRVIDESGCRWWAIENVRASVRWLRPLLGEPEMCGPCAVWHNLPFALACRPKPWKQWLSSRRVAERATLPRGLVAAVLEGVEDAMNPLWGTVGLPRGAKVAELDAAAVLMGGRIDRSG